jgi:hypothetical protein
MITGYRKAIGGHLLILATFANLPTLVGRESKKSEQRPWRGRIVGVRNRDVEGPISISGLCICRG